MKVSNWQFVYLAHTNLILNAEHGKCLVDHRCQVLTSVRFQDLDKVENDQLPLTLRLEVNEDGKEGPVVGQGPCVK